MKTTKPVTKIAEHLSAIGQILAAEVITKKDTLEPSQLHAYNAELTRCTHEIDNCNQALAFWIDRILKA